MPQFTEEQIHAALKAKSSALTPEDIRRIAESGDTVKKMISEFPGSWEKTRKQAGLLFDLIEASSTGNIDVHPDELRFAAGALIYMAEPLDIVPDDQKDGYSDDAAVIELAIEKSQEQLRILCDFKKIDLSTVLKSKA